MLGGKRLAHKHHQRKAKAFHSNAKALTFGKITHALYSKASAAARGLEIATAEEITIYKFTTGRRKRNIRSRRGTLWRPAWGAIFQTPTRAAATH